MSTNAIHSPTAWSATAPSYAKISSSTSLSQLSDAPTTLLFTQMDICSPFETASAVLDVGSGPGVTIGRLIGKYGSQFPTDMRLIASDFSSGMVDAILSRRDIELQSTSPNINPDSDTISSTNTSAWKRLEAIVLDAHTLEGIEDKSISHITGTMVYNLVADGRKAMQSANRVLAPGGVLGLTLGSGGEWIELIAQAAHSIRGSNAPTYTPNPSFTTVAGIRSEFQATGFEPVFVESVEMSMDVSDMKPLEEMFLRSKNPGVMFFVEGYSEMEMDGWVDKVKRLIEERYQGREKKLKGELIVAVGRKVE